MEKTQTVQRRTRDVVSRVALLVFACIGELLAAYGLVSSIFIVNGNRNNGPLMFWIGLLLLFPALVLLSFRRALRVRVCAVVLCMFLAFGTCFFLAFFIIFGANYEEPITLSSPDGVYEVTVREWAVFKGSGAELTFRKTGKLFASETVQVYTGECIFPFSDGDYEVVWEGNEVTVRYHTQQGEKTAFYRFGE